MSTFFGIIDVYSNICSNFLQKQRGYTSMKHSKLSEELTILTTRLMMCGTKKEIINLSSEFGKLIEKVIEQEEYKGFSSPPEKSVTATVKFTKEEVAHMAKAFKKEFIANGLVARIIKRQSGKRTFLYEIRYRRNGYNISASSTDIKEAKRRFLEMTKPENIQKYAPKSARSGLNLFREVVEEFLAFKKGKIHERTFKNYESYIRRYFIPVIGEKPIQLLHTSDLDIILSNRTPRLYEDLRSLLNSTFNYAIHCGILNHNPVSILPFKKAERISERRALTVEEQQHLYRQLCTPEYETYKQSFLLMLYFGLRPCELSDARFENDVLIARNAKRKGGKIEYKKIPIPKQAREKLDITAPIVNLHRTDVLNRIFKRIMGNEKITQYYLRHTFATVCSQYVRPDIVDIWMGDSSERLVGRVYTHFSDEFMCEQMAKVRFEI